MSRAHLHKPHHPNNNGPDEFEPGALPVEPDEGPVPTLIPGDHEHERDFDRCEPDRPAQRTRRQADVAGAGATPSFR